MAIIGEAPVRNNWKYEKRIIKCSKCKKDIVIEGDTASCFNGSAICTHCNAIK